MDRTLTARQTAIRVLISVSLAFLLAVGASLLYTKRSTDQARSETRAAVAAAEKKAEEELHRLCRLLILIDDFNKEAPPSTDPKVLTYRAEIHDLLVAYNC